MNLAILRGIWFSVPTSDEGTKTTYNHRLTLVFVNTNFQNFFVYSFFLWNFSNAWLLAVLCPFVLGFQNLAWCSCVQFEQSLHGLHYSAWINIIITQQIKSFAFNKWCCSCLHLLNITQTSFSRSLTFPDGKRSSDSIVKMILKKPNKK